MGCNPFGNPLSQNIYIIIQNGGKINFIVGLQITTPDPQTQEVSWKGGRDGKMERKAVEWCLLDASWPLGL